MQTTYYCLEDGHHCDICEQPIIACEDRVRRIGTAWGTLYQHEDCAFKQSLGIRAEEPEYEYNE